VIKIPLYPFKCLKCGKEFDEIHRMKDAPSEVKCECGGVARSWSLGINPDDPKQLAAAKKRHPGAEFNKRGQMKIHNRVEKLRRMKEAGVEEYESKRWRDTNG